MTHSLIINTICGDEIAATKTNPYRQAKYSERRKTLRQILADTYGFDEIIVAGSFPEAFVEAFPEVTWVEVAPQRNNRWDGLLQRETGARFASGETLTFCHDDHKPCKDYASQLYSITIGDSWDILIPRRVHGKTGAILNNGRDEGYMGGHCYTMKRWVWASMPLTSAPDEWWDIWFTPRWEKLGAKLWWTTELQHFDLEARDDEL